MFRRQLSSSTTSLSSTTSAVVAAPFISSAVRTYFGHDVSKGVRGESERSGPARVRSVRADRTVFDPSLRSIDELREEFDKENEQIELENAKMRAAYSGSHNHKVAAEGLAQRYKEARGDSGMTGDGSLGHRDDVEDIDAAVRNATPTRNQFSHNDPDHDINPHRNSSVGFGGFDERTSAGQDSFLSGNINDRESIRVRGQKPPPDLPLTDDEAWKHPTAKNMRVAGIFLLFLVLDVMWRLTTDPFNEGERYAKYGLKQHEGVTEKDTVPWLEMDKSKQNKDEIQTKALREAILPFRQ